MPSGGWASSRMFAYAVNVISSPCRPGSARNGARVDRAPSSSSPPSQTSSSLPPGIPGKSGIARKGGSGFLLRRTHRRANRARSVRSPSPYRSLEDARERVRLEDQAGDHAEVDAAADPPNDSGFSPALARSRLLPAVTTDTSTRLSKAIPYFRTSQPIPPPRLGRQGAGWENRWSSRVSLRKVVILRRVFSGRPARSKGNSDPAR
ncbi:MAG: hypothetical protein JWR57_605 [Mycetocola sp.]|nr:hypothetical protein [Mycetocola sp.]